MTEEEAKNILINRGFVEINGDYVYDGNKWRNAIAVISKWLEQQPCEDCISRQEAILQVQRYGVGCFDAEEFSPEQCERFVIQKLNELPSVTPKEKTGRWINKTLIYKGETEGERDCYAGTCSACGGVQECWNYCGGCGARMVSE